MAEPIVTIPLYDPIIAGMPFYEVIIFFMGMMIVFGLMLFKLEIYDRMEPVWDYQESSRKNIPIAILFGMSGKIKLKASESIANVFSAMGLPLKWIQTAPTQGQLGKVNTIIVSDDWNIVHNIDIDYAIVEAVHKWNEKHPEGDPDFIFDWETFEKHLLNGDFEKQFPHGVKLPPVRNIDLYEIRRYLPKWMASHLAAFINDEVNKRVSQEDENKQGMTLVKWALIAGGVIVICSAIGYIILTAIK